ncbi:MULTISPECIES: 4'-phosphopantetheinyl transferase superfamily protein [unclassified Paenibacillus]|uniref:4'-phosphopantetheinyl transferase family protein n=1 Tax=unclassified Paenibacillus TaxID=185978 RepID=UPI0024061CB2|nr:MULTISPECIES: 4'-phosphopantetheinyl transferase superfamily protein [unclassified Paenibacillus]MDF9843913.1 phosphopantetheinyl transferase [Paenibacillus sp. PastF-2]MDF9850518.1 phosphopantetheinyl transferase [Paenibacillus sp. PastM-2]MDF9856244.1 phosphopantetheinyl transferase [Paenibacillus sp. PastF-1]MDH6481527.1 phosphopantetheinyl transferase [Paenibacillus sp. PastH-2]MDH6509841.1 phosphopantetheinyl transferase [Paenibacillus sp. PastM-3]
MISPHLIDMKEQHAFEASEILSSTEYIMYCNICSESRRREFLYGRYAIKKNLASQSASFKGKLSGITVEYGSLRYPIIKDQPVEVGLSHSKRYVLSVVYSKDNIVGIDMETIRLEVPIEEMLSTGEKELIAGYDSSVRFAYMFFSCKEALGKAFKMGLLADYSIYEISAIRPEIMFGTEVFKVWFKNFPFLTGYSFMKNDQEICSLVVPQKIEVGDVLKVLIDT